MEVCCRKLPLCYCSMIVSVEELFNLTVWFYFKVPRVPVHTLAMVVPPQEPDRTPQENSPPLVGVVKG